MNFGNHAQAPDQINRSTNQQTYSNAPNRQIHRRFPYHNYV